MGDRRAHTTAELLYWLLRAHQSGHREGWEPGPSTDETMTNIHHVICNCGLDPQFREVQDALRDGPKAVDALLEQDDSTFHEVSHD